LTPLPPGVIAASSKRSTSPGRSSAMRSVRSMVRFGPAMTTAAHAARHCTADNVVRPKRSPRPS
jgi:hypothetical protein